MGPTCGIMHMLDVYTRLEAVELFAADWTSVGHEVVLIDGKFGATRLRFASLNQPIGVQTRQRNIIDEVWI